jgi:hypothetical protein
MEYLECGSLLPLLLPLTCQRFVIRRDESPHSKISFRMAVMSKHV